MKKYFFIFLISIYSYSQQTVTGIVSDQSGLPIPGVNIIISGSQIGTVTDFNGEYSIENISMDDVLVFSYIGFSTIEVKVSENFIIDITLFEDTELLDEVIIVGYGTQKRSDIVGSVTVVDVAEAVTQPTTDISELLRGKAAGVQITQN